MSFPLIQTLFFSVVSYIYTTADTRSEEVGEGCQESVQDIMSTEDRENSIENHTYITTGILSHCTYMLASSPGSPSRVMLMHDLSHRGQRSRIKSLEQRAWKRGYIHVSFPPEVWSSFM